MFGPTSYNILIKYSLLVSLGFFLIAILKIVNVVSETTFLIALWFFIIVISISVVVTARKVWQGIVSNHGKQMLLGDEYFSKGDYLKAIDAYKKFISYEPDHAQGYYQLVRSYLKINKPDKALLYYEILADLDEELAGELTDAVKRNP